MRIDVVVLSLAVSLAYYLQCSEACSCMPTHPQTQYCTSDFVILARIKRQRYLNHTRAYKVRVRKVYKLSEKAEVALKSGLLLTATHSSLCGAELDVGGTYALSGNVNSLKAHINLCNMAIPWKNLTKRQRKGLKKIYKQGCTCRITYCRNHHCGRTKDECNYSGICYIKEGICLRQQNKRCGWTRNQLLTACLRPDPLTISRWSG